MNEQSTARRSDRRGLALVVAMAVTVTLAALALHFHQTSMHRAVLARTFRDRYRALNIARSGIALAEEALLMDRRPYFAGVLPPGKEGEALSDANQKVDELYRRFDASRKTPMPFDGGKLSVEITDESSRINLNRTNSYSRRLLQNLLEMLKIRKTKELEIASAEVEENRIPQMGAALVDWLDADTALTADGAEDAHYDSLEKPYRTRNGYLQCIDELLLVRDYDLEVLTGRVQPKKQEGEEGTGAPARLPVTPPPAPTSVDPTEESTAPGRESLGLLPHVTIFGTTYRVNLNTAKRTVLASLPGIFNSARRDQIVEALIEHRPFKTLMEARNVVKTFDPAAWGQALSYSHVTSNYFRIRATAMVGRTHVTVDVVLQKIGSRSRIIRWRQV